MKFSKEEDDFLLNNYLAIPAKRMSKMLNRSESSARQRMKVLGIIVPPNVIKTFKDQSRFPSGHIPLNKGKKQTEYMTEAAIAKTKETRFKKGNVPPNTKEKDGVISIRTDKRGVQYSFIRVGLSNWIPLHRYNWEQINGKIPRGLKLIFNDGNTLNCDPNNLSLVTSAQLLKLNSLYNYPKDIVQVIQLRGALTRQINKHLKNL